MSTGVIFVVFSDVHADELAKGYTDSLSPEGIPCHIQDTKKSLAFLQSYIDELRQLNSCPVFPLFAGDMFHNKSYADSATMEVVGAAWKNLGGAIGITGNHDKDGRGSLLAGWTGIFDEFHYLEFPHCILVLAPYKKPALWKEQYERTMRVIPKGKPVIGLGHQALIGSRAPVGFKKHITLSDIRWSVYNILSKSNTSLLTRLTKSFTFSSPKPCSLAS